MYRMQHAQCFLVEDGYDIQKELTQVPCDNVVGTTTVLTIPFRKLLAKTGQLDRCSMA